MTEARLLEECADMIGEGDVPLVSTYALSNDEDTVDTLLGYFEVIVFTPDGTDLKYKNSVSDVAYFAYSMDDNLNFEITEVVVARDDETLNTLCAKHGIERESFDRRTGETHLEFFRTFDMSVFLENHPEYERIEYNGKMYTKDEMSALNTELVNVLISSSVE